MVEFTDEKPHLTPLVIGLTRPPMMWGIPLNAFYMSTSFWSALIAPLIYLALFAFCSRDIRILDLAQVVGRRTPRTPNRLFWRTNSYGP